MSEDGSEFKLIGTFEKNRSENIVVRLTNFKGKTYLDFRVWTKPAAGGEGAKPTSRGLCIGTHHLSELRQLIDKAIGEIELGADRIEWEREVGGVERGTR